MSWKTLQRRNQPLHKRQPVHQLLSAARAKMLGPFLFVCQSTQIRKKSSRIDDLFSFRPELIRMNLWLIFVCGLVVQNVTQRSFELRVLKQEI